jgi:hypothetical protein
MAAARAPLRGHTGFSSHMTLLYGDGAPIDRRVAPFEWLTQEPVLIRSQVGLSRPRCCDAGRWLRRNRRNLRCSERSSRQRGFAPALQPIDCPGFSCWSGNHGT